MKGILNLMCGIPASGKSTFCKKAISLCPSAVYISRDEIRFSMLKDGEDYFAHEPEVLKEFIRRIDKALNDGYTVYADATHLTPGSRKNILKKLTANPERVNAIFAKIDLETALKRNAAREGRARVPETEMYSMYRNLVEPSEVEGFDTIFILENGKEE